MKTSHVIYCACVRQYTHILFCVPFSQPLFHFTTTLSTLLSLSLAVSCCLFLKFFCLVRKYVKKNVFSPVMIEIMRIHLSTYIYCPRIHNNTYKYPIHTFFVMIFPCCVSFLIFLIYKWMWGTIHTTRKTKNYRAYCYYSKGFHLTLFLLVCVHISSFFLGIVWCIVRFLLNLSLCNAFHVHSHIFLRL